MYQVSSCVLMSEAIERIRKLKDAHERNGLKVNIRKAKVMVCGGITKDGLSKSKVDRCWACSLRAKANLVLCTVW